MISPVSCIIAGGVTIGNSLVCCCPALSCDALCPHEESTANIIKAAVFMYVFISLQK
jgi:hypothetical protein